MTKYIPLLCVLLLAACDRAPPPAPSAPPVTESKDSVELKLDTRSGAVEFKKEDGGSGDNLDVEVKTD